MTTILAAFGLAFLVAIVATRRTSKKPTWLALFGSFSAFRDSSRYATVTVKDR